MLVSYEPEKKRKKEWKTDKIKQKGFDKAADHGQNT